MSANQQISVVIPMYNSEKTILRALGSLLIQDFSFKEIIIVDDYSVDNSIEVVKDFALKNSNLKIRIINNEENKGVSYSRNIGMRNCDGDFIAFLDSDDEWCSNKIHEQLAVFEMYPDAKLVATTRNNEKFKRFFFFKFKEVSKISHGLLLYKNFFPTPTVMIKKEVFENIGGFDEKMTHMEDQDYWLKINYNYDCYLINKSLVITGGGKYNYGEQGLSSNMIEMEKGELRCLANAKIRKEISFLKMIGLFFFSFLKFIIRLVQVGLRKCLLIK